MRVIALALAVSSIVLSACSSTASTPPPPHQERPTNTPPTAGRMDGPFYMEAGAPDPRRCSVDAECAGETVTVADGCCVRDSAPIAQTSAYRQWLQARRMSPTCRAIDCGPIQPPAMPPECAFQMRCVNGQCANSCP